LPHHHALLDTVEASRAIVLVVDADVDAGGHPHVLVDDRAARTTASRPTSTSSISTESSTSARVWMRHPVETTLRRTTPPETMTPAQTIESTAMPRRSSSSNTNFAGGIEVAKLWMGHSRLYRLRWGAR
jgi:hypothetical protein